MVGRELEPRTMPADGLRRSAAIVHLRAARLEMRYEPDESSAFPWGVWVLREQAVAVDHSTGEVDQLAVVDP